MVKRCLFTGFDKWFCLNTSLPLHAVFKNHLRTLVPSQTNQNMMNVLNLSVKPSLATFDLQQDWSQPWSGSSAAPSDLRWRKRKPMKNWKPWLKPSGFELLLGPWSWPWILAATWRNLFKESTMGDHQKTWGCIYIYIFWQIWYYDKIW